MRIFIVSLLMVSTVVAGRPNFVTVDDFEDGIDPNWFLVDTNIGTGADGLPDGTVDPWGPGVFDASSGSMKLSTTAAVPPAQSELLPPNDPHVWDPVNSGFMAAIWTPSMVDSTFSNGTLRAKLRTDSETTASLNLRTNVQTFSSYNFAAVDSLNGFTISVFQNGVPIRMDPIPGKEFHQGEDWWIEAGANGPELSMKVWKSGEAEPATPQLIITDTSFQQGAIGLGAGLQTNFIDQPTMVNATFDDVSFAHVTPGTVYVASPNQYSASEAPGADTTTLPFRYQQIVPGSDFDELSGQRYAITELAFRPDATLDAAHVQVLEDVEIRLAYTQLGENQISLSLEDNYSVDPVTVFQGTLQWMSENTLLDNGTKKFDQVIPFDQPFELEPSKGNLLVEFLRGRSPNSPTHVDFFDRPKLLALAASNNSQGFRVFGGAVMQFTLVPVGTPLQAGDADQDLDFDQFDLIQVQRAAKYLTGQPASWGQGDWNGAPGGEVGNPPTGDFVFDQLDIIAALAGGSYLIGPYAAIERGGTLSDAQSSIVYDASTGELSVDAPVGVELTSINIDSATGIFSAHSAQNLGGSFDNDADNNIFKATFGGSFGSVSFGHVAQSGLAESFLLSDLAVVGSLQGGGALGSVDLIYVPEPTALATMLLGLVALLQANATSSRAM